MTLDEYNACRLPERLTFKEREAALLVLVHNMTLKAAATSVGMNEKGDVLKVELAVKMFQKAHEIRQ
jgi:predicted DNA-binding protein (UPF0251 family)